MATSADIENARPGRRPRVFYGWVVVAIAFVTMAVAINARTSFSLLYPEILAEFGWSRAVTAGAYSTGFVASVLMLPVVGFAMERFGPRIVIPLGALIVAAGCAMMTVIDHPVGLYVAMGLLLVNGSMAMSYIVHSMFLPNWFVANRGLAVGIAFSGVGVGAIVLLPLLQYVIGTHGWRMACLAMAAVVIAVIVPLNLIFQRNAPEPMGLEPDGGQPTGTANRPRVTSDQLIVDRAWAETEWTLAKAAGTVRFWAMFIAFFGALFVWYALQAHQSKFLIDNGFDAAFAAQALGVVALSGIIGQIAIGAFSDRFGREMAWTLSMAGFALASGLFVEIGRTPTIELVYAACVAQGLLGYGMSSLFGAAINEMFAGKRLASILAMISLGGNLGAAAGAWLMGYVYDLMGAYTIGFWACYAISLLSIICIWIAAPARVRRVAGRVRG